jgi:hypothetical protein
MTPTDCVDRAARGAAGVPHAHNRYLSPRRRDIGQRRSAVEANCRFRFVPGVRLATSITYEPATDQLRHLEYLRVHYDTGRYFFARRRAANRDDPHTSPPKLRFWSLTDPSVQIFLATARNGFKRSGGVRGLRYMDAP